MFTSVLRPHQPAPVRRMIQQQRYLLATRTGSGKTVMTIAACEDLLELGRTPQILVVTTEGTVDQWAAEIRRHTDHGSVLVINGQGLEARRKQYAEAKGPNPPKYVVMNYHKLSNRQKQDDGEWGPMEVGELAGMRARCVVADEVSNIKNPTTDIAQAFNRLRTPYRFGLTATPVENRWEELWGIMSWVNFHVFGPFENFERAFIQSGGSKVQRYRNPTLLREMMAPWWTVMGRAFLVDQLPDLIEGDIELDLDAMSVDLYNLVADDLEKALELASKATGRSVNMFNVFAGAKKGVGTKELGAVAGRFNALRLICSHPYLLTVSAQEYDTSGGKKGSEYAKALLDAGVLDGYDAGMVTAKIKAIQDALPTTERSVVFTSFTRTAKLLGDHIDQARVYHGGMTRKKKTALIEDFRRGVFRTLIATDAGGYGLDLPEAKTVINADLNWSAGKMTQRNGRHDRVTSTHDEIEVFDTVYKRTIEMWMREKLEVKDHLSKAVMTGVGKGVTSVAATGDSLTEFLAVRP